MTTGGGSVQDVCSTMILRNSVNKVSDINNKDDHSSITQHAMEPVTEVMRSVAPSDLDENSFLWIASKSECDITA